MAKTGIWIIVFSIVLGGCSKVWDKATTSGSSLTVALTDMLNSLEWTQGPDLVQDIVFKNAMEGLFVLKNNKPVGQLVEKWEVQNSERTYIFHLKKNVVWSDGEPLTAQHVVDGWNRAKKNLSFNFREAKVINTNTVQLDLERPNQELLFALTWPVTFPVRKEKLEGGSSLPPTLGAFKFADFKELNELILVPNEKYHGTRPKLQRVKVRFFNNFAAVQEKFKNGEVDLFVGLDPMDNAKYQDLGANVIHYLAFNLGNKPTSNPIFRRGLAMAVDREEIAKVLGAGTKPFSGFIPPGVFGFESNRGTRFDALEAQAFLQRSGYRNLTKYDGLEVVFEDNAPNRALAELVKGQWKKHLDLDVALHPLKSAELESTLVKGQWSIFLSHQISSTNESSAWLEPFVSKSSRNVGKYKSFEYDSWVQKSLSEDGTSDRQKAISKAQHLLVEEDNPILPLLLGSLKGLSQPRVQNYSVSRGAFWDLREVQLK